MLSALRWQELLASLYPGSLPLQHSVILTVSSMLGKTETVMCVCVLIYDGDRRKLRRAA